MFCRASWGLLSLHYCSFKLIWYDLFCLSFIAVSFCSSDMWRPSDQPVRKLHHPTLPELLPPHGGLQLEHQCNYTYCSIIASASVSHFIWLYTRLRCRCLKSFSASSDEWKIYANTSTWVTLNVSRCDFVVLLKKLLTPYSKQNIWANVLLWIV